VAPNGAFKAGLQLMGSWCFEQRADQADTIERWAGRLHEFTASNMWSWSTKLRAAVLLHHHHDVADLVDPPRSGRARLVSMARKLGRTEQHAQEEDACKGDDEEPLQSGRSLDRVR
jgi:hypothetical protein